jgi:hypothetical protein
MRYPEVAEMFEQCMLTLHTGVLPRAGDFMAQDALFVECLPAFVERWHDRKYNRVWQDVMAVLPKTLEALGKMLLPKKMLG